MHTSPIKLIGCAGIFAALSLTACDKQNPTMETASAPAMASQTATPTKKQTKAYDGPLGLDMGISIAELTNELGFTQIPNQTTGFKGKPPKPSNLFEDDYYVAANSLSGLCRIRAFTKTFEFNDSGDQIKQEVDSIAEALAVKYGKGKKYDFISSGGSNKPEYWAMESKNENAVYAYEWEKKGLEGTSENLKRITVEAVSFDYKSGATKVIYIFDNIDDCVKEATKKNSDNL